MLFMKIILSGKNSHNSKNLKRVFEGEKFFTGVKDKKKKQNVEGKDVNVKLVSLMDLTNLFWILMLFICFEQN